jgi:Peptidase family M23
MRLAGLLLIIFAAQPAVAQHSLSVPLSDPSVPVWHGWLYDDGSPHNGIDYKEPLGTPVLAADDGIAMSSVQPLNPNNPGKDTYGLFVLIQHPNGLSTLYAHLSRVADTIYFSTNRYNRDFALWTPVKKGDVIGFVGTSGVLTTQVVHLHFEAAINPQGDYTGHVTNKADPYDIENIGLYYPPSGPKYTSCGTKFLWTTCPPGSLAEGTIIFNNFGPAANPFDKSRAWLVGYAANFNINQQVGLRFQVPGSGANALNEIRFVPFLGSGVNQITLSIRTDSGGLPETLLESWTLTGVMGTYPNQQPVTVTSILNPTLTGGAFYWLTASASNGTSAGWSWNTIGDNSDGTNFAYNLGFSWILDSPPTPNTPLPVASVSVK